MSLYSALFYLLGIFVTVSTLLAVTRRDPVHTVIFLIFSFLGSAMIYFLLGAPFLAALEVIIYAGAIMVMFLFMVITLKNRKPEGNGSSRRSVLLAVFAGVVCLVLFSVLLFTGPDHSFMLKPAMAAPRALGKAVFGRFWLSVEAVSLLLFVALAGALYLARENGNRKKTENPDKEAR